MSNIRDMKVFRSLVALVFLLGCAKEPHALIPAKAEAPAAVGNDSAIPLNEVGKEAPSSVSDASAVRLTAVTDSHYLDAALKLIRGAQVEIELAQFQFNFGKSVAVLQEELGRAVARGVKVRVLVDSEVPKSIQSIPFLIKLGIDAKLDSPNKRTHTKMLLVDRKRALFGSSNWSEASITRTNETNILIENAKAGEALHGYFESLWSTPEKDYDGHFRAASFDILFDRQYEKFLMERLESAKRIDLQLYATRYYKNEPSSPSSAAIQKAISASKAGRSVRVIIERSDFDKVTTGFNQETADIFKLGGVPIKFDPENRTSHAKMFLSDEGVLIGSTNWGYRALREYHELNIFIRDPATMKEFQKYYERLWSEASDVH